MTTKILLPKSGMGTTEGTVAKWLKSEGDVVASGEVIAEIETAKATEELCAPVAGVISKVLVPEGQTVEVYTEIALIDERE